MASSASFIGPIILSVAWELDGRLDPHRTCSAAGITWRSER